VHNPSQDDVHPEKLRACTIREKAEVIAALLNECGEHSTWEEWRAFLHKHQVKGFEWTLSVD
jgi:hypothetical protein